VNPHIIDLKRQTERILNWEPSSHWRAKDFALLSKHVLMHTNCWLEAHDLQLFWQTSVTTPGLLDALAQFADYADWDDFCARNVAGEMVPLKPNYFHRPHWEVPDRWMVWILWGAVLASVAVGALLWWRR
jgi:hypothetical protein